MRTHVFCQIVCRSAKTGSTVLLFRNYIYFIFFNFKWWLVVLFLHRWSLWFDQTSIDQILYCTPIFSLFDLFSLFFTDSLNNCIFFIFLYTSLFNELLIFVCCHLPIIWNFFRVNLVLRLNFGKKLIPFFRIVRHNRLLFFRLFWVVFPVIICIHTFSLLSKSFFTLFCFFLSYLLLPKGLPNHYRSNRRHYFLSLNYFFVSNK